MNRRKFFSGLCSVAALSSSSAFGQVSPPFGVQPQAKSSSLIRRNTGNPFSDLPRGSFGKARIGDQLYLVGGHTGGFHCYPQDRFTDEVLSYNIKTKAWTKLKSYDFPIQGMQTVNTPNSILVFGGYRYDKVFDFTGCEIDWNKKTQQQKDTYSARSDEHVYQFNVSNNQWTQIAEMPHRRSSGVAMRVDSRIYLVAGWDATPLARGDNLGRFHTGVDVFDLQTNKFISYDARLTGQSRRALAAAEWNNKLVLLGGLNERGQPIRDVSVFDPATRQFSDGDIPNLPQDRFAPGACFTGKWLVVAGGMSNDEGGLLKSIIVCEPGKSDWTTLDETKVALEQKAMFVELVPIDERTVLAVGAFNSTVPFALMQTLQIA